MPNYCRNELHFYVSDYNDDSIPEPVRIRQILECIRETDERFQTRIQELRASDRKHKSRRYYETKDILAPSVLDFNSLFPYPEKFRQMDTDHALLSQEEYAKKYPDANHNILGTKTDFYHDGYNSGGYQWCVDHWGTKWNASASVYVPMHKAVYFDTAWSPVFQIVSEIHKRFPDVMMEYEYYEKGMGVIGGCEFIPESWFDPSDYIASQVHAIEKALKKGEEPPATLWKAGTPYNLWSGDYQGYKGG
jgi:hypothetical protein